MGTGRQYDKKFKVEAVKLAKKIGTKSEGRKTGRIDQPCTTTAGSTPSEKTERTDKS